MRPTFVRAWVDAWRDPRFRWPSLVCLPLLVATLTAAAVFLDWVEVRPGVVLPDPVLKWLPAQDVTWPIFLIIYGGVFGAVLLGANRPYRLVRGILAYSLMLAFRVVAMGVTPFEAPPGMIPLQDPVVQGLGTGAAMTKDLFFSGHTATMCLILMVVPGRRLKLLFLGGVLLVGFLVLWQHVHYTIDVVAAPFFAYASWRLTGWLHPPPREPRPSGLAGDLRR